MRSNIARSVTLAALAAVAGHAAADAVATLTVAGTDYALATQMIDGKARLVPGSYNLGAYGTLNVLPQNEDAGATLAYGLSVLNPTAGLVDYHFSFTTPIALDAGPATVVGSIVGGLTDFRGDGVALGLFQNLATVQRSFAGVGSPTDNLGVDVGNAFSAGAGSAGSLYNYGAFASPVTPGAGGWDVLNIKVDFTLSGGSDIAVLTGYTDIKVVPTPGALALAGVSGLIATRRRRA